MAVRPAVSIIAAVAFLVPAASDVSAQEETADRQAPGIYLKINGLESEAENQDHSAWMDVLAIEWGGAENPAAGTTSLRRCAGFRAGSVAVGDLTLTRYPDASSSTLTRACAEGRHFPSMVVEMTTGQSDGARYIRYDLQDVLIAGYHTDTSRGRQTESFTFNYARVESEAIPATQRGKLDSAWDVENSEP